jgi:hypothetical protein
MGAVRHGSLRYRYLQQEYRTGLVQFQSTVKRLRFNVR